MIKISTYIHFTKEQREQARRTDLANFLVSRGEKVRKSGSEYEWLDGSQKVTIRGHLWYHQYEQKGGDAVDFVRRFYNKDYTEAVQMLLNNCGSQIITSPPIEKEHKPFKLPPRNDRMSRVFSYLLLTREIDKDVLFEFVKNKMIYESAYYHNVVFVGYDLNGIPRHAHKKNWKEHSYAASCSVSDRVLFQCLKDNPNIKNVFLCFDNDEAGQTANKRIADKLNSMNIKSEILIPTHKDWNEDILNGERTDEIFRQVL